MKEHLGVQSDAEASVLGQPNTFAAELPVIFIADF